MYEKIRVQNLHSILKSTDNEVENEIMANFEKHSQYIYYTSHKIDWSNTRIVKLATNTINFLALTDDDKVKYCDDIIMNILVIIIINFNQIYLIFI